MFLNIKQFSIILVLLHTLFGRDQGEDTVDKMRRRKKSFLHLTEDQEKKLGKQDVEDGIIDHIDVDYFDIILCSLMKVIIHLSTTLLSWDFRGTCYLLVIPINLQKVHIW